MYTNYIRSFYFLVEMANIDYIESLGGDICSNGLDLSKAKAEGSHCVIALSFFTVNGKSTDPLQVSPGAPELREPKGQRKPRKCVYLINSRLSICKWESVI